MAVQNFFYDYDHNSTTYFTSYVALKEYFANLLFDGDGTRIVPASNEQALRRRQDSIKEQTHLFFPFMNLRRTTDFFRQDSKGHWNNRLFGDGIWVPEIGAKLQMDPVSIPYEATVWLSTEHDLHEAYRRLRFNEDGLTEIEFSTLINEQEFCNFMQLNTDISYDPTYNDSDWLERNKIHTISVPFTVYTWLTNLVFPGDLDGEGNPIYSITEKVIYTFRTLNQIDDSVTNEQVIQLLYDELEP